MISHNRCDDSQSDIKEGKIVSVSKTNICGVQIGASCAITNKTDGGNKFNVSVNNITSRPDLVKKESGNKSPILNKQPSKSNIYREDNATKIDLEDNITTGDTEDHNN